MFLWGTNLFRSVLVRAAPTRQWYGDCAESTFSVGYTPVCEPGGNRSLEFRSPAFDDGMYYLNGFTCDGSGVFRPSAGEVTPGTYSFILICEDPDTSNGPFHPLAFVHSHGEPGT